MEATFHHVPVLAAEVMEEEGAIAAVEGEAVEGSAGEGSAGEGSRGDGGTVE